MIVTENSAGREIVAMGRGIAFKRRIGDNVADSAVEKIYTISRANMMDRFIELPTDEAGFIALHIIDAQLDFRQPMANRILNLMEEIMTIVRLTCRVDFDRESLNYYRFVTHLKFFAKRVFMRQESSDEIDDDMSAIVKAKYMHAVDCVEKIARLVD